MKKILHLLLKISKNIENLMLMNQVKFRSIGVMLRINQDSPKLIVMEKAHMNPSMLEM
jgi:hypothetical protein